MCKQVAVGKLLYSTGSSAHCSVGTGMGGMGGEGGSGLREGAIASAAPSAEIQTYLF